MNKHIQTILSLTVFLAVCTFSGIGIHHTVNDYFYPPETNSVASSAEFPPVDCQQPSSFITGPLTALTGELCVFKLNDAAVKADWAMIPPAAMYIDSSGSSLAFASNVPAKYTVVAAVVENGQPKILTHVCEYGTSPEPEPTPKPKPIPPVTLKDWVSQNVPPDGKEQAAALADSYESVALSLNNGTVKTIDAAYALLRRAAQTKINVKVWKPFLDELSVKVAEELNGSDDVRKLALIFNAVADGLKVSQEDSVEIESRYLPEEVKRAVFRRDGGQCLCCGATSDLEFDHIYPYSKGGQNGADNLQLLCRRCNASKNTGTHCRIHGKDLSLKP